MSGMSLGPGIDTKRSKSVINGITAVVPGCSVAQEGQEVGAVGVVTEGGFCASGCAY